MTYTPPPILELKRYLTAQGASVSIARFCEPTSGRRFRGYHLGKDQIMGGGDGCPPSGTADYSIQNERDKAGLSNARAAIDIQFARLRLQRFSKWLVAQAQASAPGTSDLREIIYSPDGVKVLRYDRERGVSSAPREGEADNSHLWHTHVSFYRDSESQLKVPTFSGFFTPPPPPEPTPTPPAETDAEKAARLEAELAAANAELATATAALDAAETELAKDETADTALDAAIDKWRTNRG